MIEGSDLIGKAAGGRKLIAVVYADMVGYSRLIGLDDIGTLERLRILRRILIDPAINEHGGRVFQTGGDSLLIVFDSIDGAVRCAISIQRQVPDFDGEPLPDRAIRFRIGINIGDVIADGTNLHGEGVNVAARLQVECPPGGICVSRAVRDHVHGRLDLAFDELGALHLKNIIRPVEAYVLRFRDVATSTPGTVEQSFVQSTSQALPPLDKPSIAVLPFINLSGDPEQVYFADGMVEEVITALSRIPWLFVIARNSSFTYRGQDIDVKQVGRELGVRYVLEGAVQKAARRLRITAQLIEAESGVHLWADRFDGSLEDIFDLQDTVASSVASVIEPALQVGEIRRASQRPTNDLTAYDLYLRAMPFFWSLSRDGIHQALALLGQAIDCDAQFGPALAWAAICHLRLHQDGWTEDPEMTFQRGRDFASRALQRAASDPGVIANAVFPLAYFGENITAMMAVLDECLVLNPNFARGWFVSGHLRLMAGHCDTAIEHAERSLRLSPRIRNGAHWGIVGMGHFFSRRFELAAAKLLVQIHELPGSPSSYRFLAATYAHMGQLNEARKVIAQIRAITPLLMQPMIYRIPEHRELYVSGLSLAAGE